jgi:hypothetical protein
VFDAGAVTLRSNYSLSVESSSKPAPYRLSIALDAFSFAQFFGVLAGSGGVAGCPIGAGRDSVVFSDGIWPFKFLTF